MARFNTDGTLDTTFDGDGLLAENLFPPWEHAQATTLQTVQGEERLVLVGETGTDLDGNNTNGSFAVARFRSDGSLDQSFGTGGLVTDGGSIGA